MKTETEKHTPTPWQTANEYDTTEYQSIADSLGFRIVRCLKSTIKQTEPARANAEFIVRAVNNHEALLEYARHKENCEALTSHREENCNCGFSEIFKAAAQAEVKS